MKATACAHPIQGLISQLMDERVRLPFHDSISVCTAPSKTVTTVEFGEEKEITINGEVPDTITMKRAEAVISEIKKLSGVEGEYKIVSEDSIPRIGFYASSRFASLAVAAAKAAGLDLSDKELSRIARKGAVSASEAVTGWFSRWRANMLEESCYSYVVEDDLEMGMVAAAVEVISNEVQKEVLTSPFFEARLKTVHKRLYEMERALRDHDIQKIGQLAERDSIVLHTLMMNKEMMWDSDTLRVVAEVKALREGGVKAYFNVGLGAVYVNSYPEDVPIIEERVKTLGVKTARLCVGSGTHVMNEHLF